MASWSKSDQSVQLWLLVIGAAVMLQISVGQEEKCQRSMATIVDIGQIHEKDQNHTKKFIEGIEIEMHKMVNNYEQHLILTNNAGAFLKSSDNEKATLLQGIDKATDRMINYSPTDPNNVILIITDWSGEITAQNLLYMVSRAHAIATVVVVAVGVNKPSKKKETLLQLVGGQQLRMLIVDEYEQLEDRTNVDTTVNMVCPGVPTTCSVGLKMKQSANLTVTCHSNQVNSTEILQNATGNLMRCRNKLNSNMTITIEDDSLDMCAIDLTLRRPNCIIETTGMDLEQYMIIILSKLDEDCTYRSSECEIIGQGRRPILHNNAKCDNNILERCHDQGFDIFKYMMYQSCSCESVRSEIAVSLRDCAKMIRPNEKDLQELAENAMDKKNAELAVYANTYTGPVIDLLKLKAFAQVLPRERIGRLNIQDIDNMSSSLFVKLPLPKKLALTRQTLSPLAFIGVKEEIENNFKTKGCGFVGSINVSVLMEPGHVSLDLALDMCNCSEQESEHIPAKMDSLCKIISTKTNTLQKLMEIQQRLCSLCLAHILKNRPAWQSVIVADEIMRNAACDKIGQSFILPTSVLTQWAAICTPHYKVGDCSSSRPSLMLHGLSPPSVADLALCKEVFCHRLCHLTEAEMDVIRQTLNKEMNEDVGCLAYLDDYTPQPVKAVPAFDGRAIPGSCQRRSNVIKRAQQAEHHRKKRAPRMGCTDITEDIKDGIVPSHVLDAQRIEADLSTDVYNCIKTNNLGDYQWNVEQAKAIHKQLRHSGSFHTTHNWTSSEVKVLGYIGLGFTPDELQNMGGISNIIYGTFGAAYGWSPEQLHILAQRYLNDNNLTEPHSVQYFDIARLNHLVCGLQAQFVKGITLKAIVDSTPILGRMQRCKVEVLEVLAQRLVLYYGPVRNWPEDHFSEFGIILAGLSGEDLRSVGLALSDFITVPVVNHIRPTEFWKLTPDQMSLFSYDVSLAASRRGLCAWLTDQHKQGYLEHLCAGAGTVTPSFICALFLLVLDLSGLLL